MGDPGEMPHDRMLSITCSVFASVLGVEEVSTEQSLVELGGTSVVAMRIMARLRKELDTDFPRDAVFRHPTPRAFCDSLRGGSPTWSPTVGSSHGPSSAQAAPSAVGVIPTPLVAAAYARALNAQDWAQGQWPVWVLLDTAVRVDASRLEAAWAAVVGRHDGLRTVLRHVRGELEAEVLVHVRPEVLTIDLFDEPDAAVEDLVLERVRRPLDRLHPPLAEIVLVRRNDTDVLLVIADHNLVDGWALDILVRELDLWYHSPEPCSAVALQLSEWSTDQHRKVETDGAQALAHWRSVSASLGSQRLVELQGRSSELQTGEPGSDRDSREFRLAPQERTRMMDAAAQDGLSLYTIVTTYALRAVARRCATPVLGWATHSLNRSTPAALGMIASCSSELWMCLERADLVGEESATARAVYREFARALHWESLGVRTVMGAATDQPPSSSEPTVYITVHEDSDPATFGENSSAWPVLIAEAGQSGLAVVALDRGQDIVVQISWELATSSSQVGEELVHEIETALHRHASEGFEQ